MAPAIHELFADRPRVGQVFEKLDNSYKNYDDDGLLEIVTALARSDIDTAQKIAEHISDKDLRDSALIGIAGEVATKHGIPTALKLVNKISILLGRNLAVDSIAQRQAYAGDIAGALNTAKSMV